MSVSARELEACWLALRLARRGYGRTSPNPMVGALLIRGTRIVGQGWHRGAGRPHAEIEAIQDARRRGRATTGTTLCVTLEPCSTQGRTPPCTATIVEAGVRRVIACATDPNPRHAGRGFRLLRQAGIEVETGVLESEATELNAAFNHWIVHRTPFVTVKAAMTLDGKIAAASGDSKWITGPAARREAMRLRRGHDAVLVGINTVLADDPALTVRSAQGVEAPRQPLRIVLDPQCRVPLDARILTDRHFRRTVLVIGTRAPKARFDALPPSFHVMTVNQTRDRLDLRDVLQRLGALNITSLMVEGGGQANASFLFADLAHRIAFFFAPKILGGRGSIRAVAGPGARHWAQCLKLRNPTWRRFGPDLLLSAEVVPQGVSVRSPRTLGRALPGSVAQLAP